MIRGRDYFSLAVRREDGSIEDLQERLNPIYNGRLRRWPLVRGVLALMETLVLGIKALQISANIASTSASQPAGETRGIPGWMMASTLAFSLVFGIGLFFLLPLGVVRVLEPSIGSGLMSELVEGGLRLAILVAYVALIGTMRDIRRVYAYHGAEHMTVHAYEAGTAPECRQRAALRHPSPPLWHRFPAHGGGCVGGGVHRFCRLRILLVVADRLPHTAFARNRRRQL